MGLGAEPPLREALIAASRGRHGPHTRPPRRQDNGRSHPAGLSGRPGSRPSIPAYGSGPQCPIHDCSGYRSVTFARWRGSAVMVLVTVGRTIRTAFCRRRSAARLPRGGAGGSFAAMPADVAAGLHRASRREALCRVAGIAVGAGRPCADAWIRRDRRWPARRKASHAPRARSSDYEPSTSARRATSGVLTSPRWPRLARLHVFTGPAGPEMTPSCHANGTWPMFRDHGHGRLARQCGFHVGVSEGRRPTWRKVCACVSRRAWPACRSRTLRVIHPLRSTTCHGSRTCPGGPTAIDRWGEDVLLTARAECCHVGQPDPLRESVHRLRAYVDAGATCSSRPDPRRPQTSRHSSTRLHRGRSAFSSFGPSP